MTDKPHIRRWNGYWGIWTKRGPSSHMGYCPDAIADSFRRARHAAVWVYQHNLQSNYPNRRA